MPSSLPRTTWRPFLRPWTALGVLVAAFAGVLAILELAVRASLGHAVAPGFHFVIVLLAYEGSVGLALIALTTRRLIHESIAPDAPPATVPAVSVLIAAYNEATIVAHTVRELSMQTGVDTELIVGDDGSDDGTHAVLVAAFALRPAGRDEWSGTIACADGRSVPLRVVRREHTGKGATLNAIAQRAVHPVLITVDADTTPADGALARLAAPFADAEVSMAAGVVTVRNGRDGWLTWSQSIEYLKNALERIAWSSLGALEQVPGAFAAVRATDFRAAGGFPVDSLTEDYELTFRLVARGVKTGRPPVVVTVPRAQVFTEAPRTIGGFVRQRTRWFAGFLTTLFRFRRLVLDPRGAGVAIVRLPLKLVDAVLPLIAFASLYALVREGASALPRARVAVTLYAARWAWDLVVYGLAVVASRALGDRDATRRASPSPVVAWLCAATEAFTFVWLRRLAALRGYVWAVGRLRVWEASRGPATDHSRAPSTARLRGLASASNATTTSER